MVAWYKYCNAWIYVRRCYVRREISEASVESGQYQPKVSSNLPPEPI